MQHPVIILTGAAGFLGSALTVDLSPDHSVVAIDRREPGGALVDAAPQVDWFQVDIFERKALAEVFEATRRRYGRIDIVVHLAAFYHFDLDWHPEYERTNLRGTANVVQLAIEFEASRLIFASSVLAMNPPSPGAALDERTPTAELIPYGKSKAMAEAMITEASDQIPSIVLRIGGVFSDWCELPPLSSLIKLWNSRKPFNRVVVGRGDTGFPYLHRADWVRFVRSCVERHRGLESLEVFLASQNGAVSHQELFHATSQARSAIRKPIHVQPTFARIGLQLMTALGRITGELPYERAWMLNYIDRPWVTDTTFTTERLGWDISDNLQICERLPVLLSHFDNDRSVWDQRNQARGLGLYSYAPD